MKPLQAIVFAVLLPLLSGCTVERGCFDFVANPIFDLHLGNCASLMCFRDSTVLQIGSTYCTLNMPFYLLLTISALAVLIVGWFTDRFSSKKSGAGVSDSL